MKQEHDANISPTLPAFQRLKRRLHRMAGAILGNDDEAADTLQDAFCRLWSKRDGIKTENEAAALLTTTVKHLSIDTLRQRKRFPINELDEEHELTFDNETEAITEREELYRRVETLIDQKLSPTAREILKRKEFLGESFETIAQALNMQETAVRMQLSRARKTIRECYRQQTDSL